MFGTSTFNKLPFMLRCVSAATFFTFFFSWRRLSHVHMADEERSWRETEASTARGREGKSTLWSQLTTTNTGRETSSRLMLHQ